MLLWCVVVGVVVCCCWLRLYVTRCLFVLSATCVANELVVVCGVWLWLFFLLGLFVVCCFLLFVCS